MDIFLSHTVVSGHLSNEIPNLITGTIHLTDSPEPLIVKLRGNFMRDIAGCRIEFTNPLPQTDAAAASLLHVEQEGTVGEITASRRIRRLTRRAQPAAWASLNTNTDSLKNLFFAEWFNSQGQRVIIQACHWTLGVSAPDWSWAADDEIAHLKTIRARRRRFLLARGSR